MQEKAKIELATLMSDKIIGDVHNWVCVLSSLVPRYEAWTQLYTSVLDAQVTVLDGMKNMLTTQRNTLCPPKPEPPQGPIPVTSDKGPKPTQPRTIAERMRRRPSKPGLPSRKRGRKTAKK